MPQSERISLAPFTIVVDSREQAPYGFDAIPARSSSRGVPCYAVKVACLDAGDYSVEGMEDRVSVERKSLEDLYGTLGQGRERFEREFQRLMKKDFAAVVVEAGWQEIIRPTEARSNWHSKLNPRSVWGTVFSWSQRFPKVHWYTMGSRRLAEIATFEILERFWREYEEKERAAVREIIGRGAYNA